MKKVTVLGAGLVGSAMVHDLSKSFQVQAVDLDPQALNRLNGFANITTTRANALDPGLFLEITRGSDLIIGALPGNLGYQSVKMAIEAGIHMVDISFFPEDPFQLDRLAQHQGVTILTDLGVAPGMGNLLLGYHNARMKVDAFRCMVGGLPFKREWPWQYRAVFSPIDVIEEYTRPARFRVNGKEVIREALSDPELVSFDGIGTLEAFNTDGLRSLLTTMNIPDMIEKTLRYPGTIDYLRMLRQGGFFSEEPVQVKDQWVRPIDLTASMVFPQWKLEPGEEEFTVMRVEITGFEEGQRVQYRYDLFDRYDRDTQTTSMARTTGYTATAAANLILEGSLRKPGVNPPELIGDHEAHFQYILSYLKERGIHYVPAKSSL